MRVEDLMSSDPEFCQRDDSLDRVMHQMRERDSDFMPVIDLDGRVIAVITDRDIALAAAEFGRLLSELRASDAMSERVFACRMEDDVVAVEEKMRDALIRRIPVVDDELCLVGVLSLHDVALARDVLDGAPVGVARAASTHSEVSQHRA